MGSFVAHVLVLEFIDGQRLGGGSVGAGSCRLRRLGRGQRVFDYAAIAQECLTMPTDAAGSSLWVVLIAAVPSIAAGIWVFWKFWIERADRRAGKVADVTLTREERIMKEMDLRAATLSKENADLFDRAKAELLRAQTRCADLERDRDRLEQNIERGWNLARYWFRKAYDLLHEMRDARQMFDAVASKGAATPREWREITFPAFEEPT